MLVSRDTSNLSNTGVNKAAIETYGENLSDGVIAPLFYLLCFGIVGAFCIKLLILLILWLDIEMISMKDLVSFLQFG
jgi:cobalamin biosynthesis protein CobD/CbiB